MSDFRDDPRRVRGLGPWSAAGDRPRAGGHSADADARRPTFGHVVEAARRLRGHVIDTPVIDAPTLGGSLKLENLQVSGAYKARGALNALLVQVARGDRRPVVAASAGNHAAGVAWAGAKLGLEVFSVVPETAPAVKVARIERFGGRVIKAGSTFEAAFLEAERLAELHGWRLLHAFDDFDVIAGQGSLGVELIDLCPDVVLVPIGGGGLAAGVGTYLSTVGVSVVGVQVHGVDAMAQRLGHAPRGPVTADTVADGVAVRRVGDLTAAVCAEVLDDVVTVSEAEVRETMRRLALEAHVVAEGAGAVAAAALSKVPGQRKVAVVTGGNVDASVLREVLAEDVVWARGPSRSRAAVAAGPRWATARYALPATLT